MCMDRFEMELLKHRLNSQDQAFAGLAKQIEVLRSELEASNRSMAAGLESARAEMREQTEGCRELSAETRDVLEWIHSMRGAMRVLNALGALIRPVGWIAAAVASLLALWSAVKTFKGL